VVALRPAVHGFGVILSRPRPTTFYVQTRKNTGKHQNVQIRPTYILLNTLLSVYNILL